MVCNKQPDLAQIPLSMSPVFTEDRLPTTPDNQQVSEVCNIGQESIHAKKTS